MPSIREQLEDLKSRLTHLNPRDRSVGTYRAFATELDLLDDKLRHAVPDDQIELGKLSAQVRGVLDRQLHEWQYPTILSPQPPPRPDRGFSVRERPGRER